MNKYINIINNIRREMELENITYYIITKLDYHQSEYVSEYFEAINFTCGFSGSNAVALVTMQDFVLWTDGRYDVQAAEELEGLDAQIYITSMEGTPTIVDYLMKNVSEIDAIGFDGRVMSALMGEIIEKITIKRKCRFIYDVDLISRVWTDRPEFVFNKIFILEDKYSGMSCTDKIVKVQRKLAKIKRDFLVISKLDDIMWLFNIRGRDVPYNLIAYSHCIVTQDNIYLYIKKEIQDVEIMSYLQKNNVTCIDYDEFETELRKFARVNEGKRGIIDFSGVSYATRKVLEASCKIKNESSPTNMYKAIKNEEEIKNLKNVYLLDSVILTKFIYWVKNTDFDGGNITEMDISKKMYEMRSEAEGFIDLSFETISAYGANGAKMHYSVEDESALRIKNEGMLLVDSGSQYLGGTTDVTRTIALGPLDDNIKEMYSACISGMLRLQNSTFIKGCTGRNIDILAREPLWKLYSDYKCGTGHGIGYMLNVHEGPHAIRYKYNSSEIETIFQEGMIVSNEPGVYVEGKYGIRVENIMRCIYKNSVASDTYLGFSPLTYVPLELEAIDRRYLTSEDIVNINEYNKLVKNKLSEYLSKDEKKWLDEATREL